jgi:hypothetical protein
MMECHDKIKSRKMPITSRKEKKVIIEERNNKCQKSMPRKIVKKKDTEL